MFRTLLFPSPSRPNDADDKKPNTHKGVRERVYKVTADELGVDEDKFNDESLFVDDLGADSLDTVELIMSFEEEFEIEIEDLEAEKIQTVGDAIAFIQGKI